MWSSSELERTAASFSRRRSRRCRARASGGKTLAGAGDDGEQARVLWKQWGWRWWPEFERELAGDSGVRACDSSSLVAMRSWRLRGIIEGGEALMRSRSHG